MLSACNIITMWHVQLALNLCVLFVAVEYSGRVVWGWHLLQGSGKPAERCGSDSTARGSVSRSAERCEDPAGSSSSYWPSGQRWQRSHPHRSHVRSRRHGWHCGRHLCRRSSQVGQVVRQATWLPEVRCHTPLDCIITLTDHAVSSSLLLFCWMKMRGQAFVKQYASQRYRNILQVYNLSTIEDFLSTVMYQNYVAYYIIISYYNIIHLEVITRHGCFHIDPYINLEHRVLWSNLLK